MTLTPSLDSIAQLYRKLEREQYRAYHSRRRIHKADHFFNFCITAQSLRDYFFERKAILTKGAQTSWHQLWAQQPLLVAVSEIANLSKHFALRAQGLPRVPKTRNVRQGKGQFIDVYQDSAKAILYIRTTRPDVKIVLSDGTEYQLHEFLGEVVAYWRKFLNQQGIKVRRQSVRQLLDE